MTENACGGVQCLHDLLSGFAFLFPPILCDSMTVAEHILFYSLLKGRPAAEAEEEVENMLQDLGFPHKRDELIQNLSGLTTVAQNPYTHFHPKYNHHN